jgi:hypothetical protein
VQLVEHEDLFPPHLVEQDWHVSQHVLQQWYPPSQGWPAEVGQSVLFIAHLLGLNPLSREDICEEHVGAPEAAFVQPSLQCSSQQ